MVNIVGMIPARAGSKRLPRKNIKLLGGKPLITWTIEAALKVGFSHVVVSTDDYEIAKIAKCNGAEVPFMRSPELSTDEANIVSAVNEVISFFENKGERVDAVMLLQPTSPFRTSKLMDDAISLYKLGNKESVVSVSPAISHPYWCKKIEGGYLRPFVSDGERYMEVRSQDLPPVYELNGAIYLSAVDNLRKQRSFYSKHTHALIIDSKEECLDIDVPFDWLIAEAIVNKKSRGG
jgi:CMP-N-acetylneuraminic acid synthetase